MRWRFRPALGSPSPYRRTRSIMPSNTISRVDEKLAGKIDELAMASFGQSPIVTAVVTTSHHLELIAWTVATSGLLTRIGHHDGAEASGIDCAFLTDQRVIAAYQGHNGHLEVHAYHLDPAATPIFTKLAHEGGPTASFVKLVGIDDERFASLIVRPTSAAHLTIWRYHSHALESLGRVEWPITFDGAPPNRSNSRSCVPTQPPGDLRGRTRRSRVSLLGHHGSGRADVLVSR